MSFAKILKDIRKEKGITQSQLAAELSVTDAAVRQWENRGSEPSYEMLCKIAKIFDVTIGQLLGAEEY